MKLPPEQQQEKWVGGLRYKLLLDTKSMELKLRAISKHLTALADELEQIDNCLDRSDKNAEG